MTQSTQPEPIPSVVTEALKHLAKKHIYVSLEEVPLGPLAELALHRYHQVINDPCLIGRSGNWGDVLQAECANHLLHHRIPHGSQSSRSAIVQLDLDLIEHFSGIQHELILQREDQHFDLADPADQPLSA